MNIELYYYLHMIVCRNTVPNSTHSETVGMLQEPSCREVLFLPFIVQMARMCGGHFFIVVVAFHHLCWKCKSCYSKPIVIVRKIKFHLLLTDGNREKINRKPHLLGSICCQFWAKKTQTTGHEELWLAGDFSWWTTRQMHILLWIFTCLYDFCCVLVPNHNTSTGFCKVTASLPLNRLCVFI